MHLVNLDTWIVGTDGEQYKALSSESKPVTDESGLFLIVGLVHVKKENVVSIQSCLDVSFHPPRHHFEYKDRLI